MDEVSRTFSEGFACIPQCVHEVIPGIHRLIRALPVDVVVVLVDVVVVASGFDTESRTADVVTMTAANSVNSEDASAIEVFFSVVDKLALP